MICFVAVGLLALHFSAGICEAFQWYPNDVFYHGRRTTICSVNFDQSQEESVTNQRRIIIKKINASLFGFMCGTFVPTTVTQMRAKAEINPPTNLEISISNNNIPSAPSLENLLPATRVRVWIYQLIELATQLSSLATSTSAKNKHNNNKEQQEILLAQLQDLLLEPRVFTTSQAETKASQRYLKQQTLDQWSRARREETKQKFQIESVDPLTQLSESFERFGERGQFRSLRARQQALEKADPIRAAFNTYTNNLVFTNEYLLNASEEEKRRLIRQYGQLPDVSSVIQSDLDLRDLYRNQILTALDDAKAELLYQSKNWDEMAKEEDTISLDTTDLVGFLKEAQDYCDKWFEFVPQNELNAAIDVVMAEKSKLKMSVNVSNGGFTG